MRLEVGDISRKSRSDRNAALIDAATTSVGHVIDGRTVQETPLNGRYFLDLALLAPGFGYAVPDVDSRLRPAAVLGALAINTAGNREETVNYMINGITLNNLVSSAILFQPSISTVQEFKIDNTTFSAEYGQSSGADCQRGDALGYQPIPRRAVRVPAQRRARCPQLLQLHFQRTAALQTQPVRRQPRRPIVRSRTFFFFSYEGLRQAQELNLNSVVLSDAERNSATDSVIAKLVELIPRPNFIDSAGTPRFVGSAPGPVNIDQWAHRHQSHAQSK